MNSPNCACELVDRLHTFPLQTIGAAFGAKKVSISGESVTLGIWVNGTTLVCCAGTSASVHLS